MMDIARSIYRFLWGHSTFLALYRYDRVQQGAGYIDPVIQCYDGRDPMPDLVTKVLIKQSGNLSYRLLRRRTRQYGGFLLVLIQADVLIAYGWIQSWQPFKREYKWLGREWVCLGPYWTSPDYRGRGLYGRLLQHSIAECFARGWFKAYIWANINNTPSIRGIEKAEFVPVGSYKVSRYLSKLICSVHRIN